MLYHLKESSIAFAVAAISILVAFFALTDFFVLTAVFTLTDFFASLLSPLTLLSSISVLFAERINQIAFFCFKVPIKMCLELW